MLQKKPEFSRSNPSQRYLDLIAQYRTMHESGEQFIGLPADDTFPGYSLLKHVADVKRLITRTGAQSILDYGSGKGMQYRPRRIEVEGEAGRWEGVAEYWDVDNVTCHDPSYAPFSEIPAGKFDGVVCTDVLEHCPEEDLGWIIDGLFGFARCFVFATIACYPAKKRLPTGENAHITLQPPRWWRARFAEAAKAHSGITWEIIIIAAGAAAPGEPREVRYTG